MRRVFGAAAMGLALATACLQTGCASNAAKGSETERPTYSLSFKFLQSMSKITEHTKKKDWPSALAYLDEVAARKYLNPAERASICQARSGIHFAMNDNNAVIKDLEQAVAFDALPEKDQLNAEYDLAQSYFQAERFSDAANTFAKWAPRAKDVEPARYFVVASTFSQAKRFAEALPFAEKATAGTKLPEEGWLHLLVSIQFELHDDAAVAAALERMVAAYPKKEYWLQLSETYITLHNEAKALEILETAQTKGLLSEEKEYVSLAQLYLRSGAPLKAANLLDQQMRAGKIEKIAENLELLAKSWLQAKDVEKAESVLNMSETEVSSGEVYLELGRQQVERGAWGKAREALSRALQQGGLTATGEARLLLGIAHYNSKDKSAALAALGEAQKQPDSASCATEWLQFVKSGKPAPTAACAVGPAGSSAVPAAAPPTKK